MLHQWLTGNLLIRVKQNKRPVMRATLRPECQQTLTNSDLFATRIGCLYLVFAAFVKGAFEVLAAVVDTVDNDGLLFD